MNQNKTGDATPRSRRLRQVRQVRHVRQSRQLHKSGMWAAFFTVAIAIGASDTASAQATPIGYWRAVDVDTNQPTSIVRITEGRDGLSGQIQTVLDARLAAGAVCTKCEGDRRAKPLVGLDVIRQARRDKADPTLWTGGEILDPENGKVYSLQLKPIDGGQKLEVRGYIGTPFLGRTQTWVRVDEIGRDMAAPPPEAPALAVAPTAPSAPTVLPATARPSLPMTAPVTASVATETAPAPARATVAVPATVAAAPTNQTPIGLWTAVDADSNRETSLVRIAEGSNGLTGRIVKLLDREPRTAQTCTACEGERRGKPLVGLDIIRQARPDAGNPGVWSGGEVLDPENGKVYSLQLKPVDGGQKLEVRGYIGSPLLGRTQTWVRVE